MSTIRTATDEDIEAIRDIAEAAWYAGVGGALDPAAIAEAIETYYDPEIVAAGVEADSVAFYVAETEAGNGATDGKPSDEGSMDGESTDEASMDGESTDEASMDGESTDEASMDGESTDEASMDGESTDEASMDGESTDEASMDGESTDEASMDGESTVVGFASAERTWADEVELHTIYVHPDRWGEGVGAALLDEVAAWARAEGADRIACGVLADNAVGVGFFEAVGFRRGRKTEAEIAGSVREEYEYELSL